MAILLVSDIHADEYSRFSKFNEKEKMNSRLYWTLDIFDQIWEEYKHHKEKILLIGGDLLDKRGVISVPTYYHLHRKLKRLKDEGWQVEAIVGNHDQSNRGGFTHSLAGLPISVHEKEAAVWYKGELGEFWIGFVSYTENNQSLLKSLKDLKQKHDPQIYLLHVGVRGARFAGDEILSKDELRPEDIRSIVGEDPWIFSGHYHIHQEIDPRFYYIGSATPKDFGDTETKGYICFDGKSVMQYKSRAPEFFVLDYEDVSPTDLENLSGSYVKILYKGKEPEVDASKFEGCVLKREEPNAVRDRRSEISADDSPMKIFESYLTDVFKNGYPFGLSMGDLITPLETVIGSTSLSNITMSKKIQPVSLSLQNFFSYADSTLNFKNLEGIIRIEGRNKDDPSALDNGSGKSSLPEALRWCLFGTTSRGVSGDAVVNKRVGKDCCVELTLKIGADEFKIRRYRKDKKFKNELFFSKGDFDLRGKSDSETQEIVCRTLGIDEATFENTVFFGNGLTRPFASITDKQQKSILDNIVGCEYFSGLQKKAAEISNDYKTQITDKKVRNSYLKSREIEESENNKNLKRKSEDWEKQREAKIASCKSALLEEENEVKVSSYETEKKELDELQSLMEDLAIPYQEYVDLKESEQNLISKISLNLREIDGIKNKIIPLQKQNIRTSERLAVLDSEIKKLTSGLESKTCPTCEQKIQSGDSIEKKIAAKQEEVNQLLKDWDASKVGEELLNEQLYEHDSYMSSLEDSKINIQKEMGEIQEFYSKYLEVSKIVSEKEKELSRCKAGVQSRVARMEELLRNISAAEEETNPIEDLISLSEKRILEIRLELDSIDGEILKLEKNYNCYKFWELAFSDKGSTECPPIKGFVFDSILPTLEEITKRYAEILTAGSIDISFDTTTALKSGEIRDKFSVKVKNQYGAEEYLGDSGGERRKVDLSIMFALNRLARVKAGSTIGLLFLDEILDSLDPEGCVRVMHLLQEISGEIGLIFLITHNQTLKEVFSDVLTVEKSQGFSVVLNG